MPTANGGAKCRLVFTDAPPRSTHFQMDFSAWLIQTGPFAACGATFLPKIFQLFGVHTGGPFLITPEG